MYASFQKMSQKLIWIHHGDDGDVIKRFFKAVSDENRKFKPNSLVSTGKDARRETNGLGNVHSARRVHVIPLHLSDKTEHPIKRSDPEKPKVKQLSSTQQAVDIARSEEQREETVDAPKAIKGKNRKKKIQSKRKRPVEKSSYAIFNTPEAGAVKKTKKR